MACEFDFSELAADPKKSKRKYDGESDSGEYRSSFDRDRDRVLYSKDSED